MPDPLMLDLDAGKYAAYIWPAFGVTAAVLAWMVIDSLLRARRWRKAAESLERDGIDPAA